VRFGVALSQFYECPFVEYDERILAAAGSHEGPAARVPAAQLLVADAARGRRVVVADRQPADLQRVDSVSQALKNRKVKWAVGLRKDILLFLNQVSGEGAGRDSIGTILAISRNEDGRRTRWTSAPAA